jgi:hypothetical protein
LARKNLTDLPNTKIKSKTLPWAFLNFDLERKISMFEIFLCRVYKFE